MMNTKKFKRIFSLVNILLVALIFVLFFGTCLVIDPIKGLDLSKMKYDGYHAFFGVGSEFGTSVGSITVVILLGIVLVLSITTIIFPKISIIFNVISTILVIVAASFIFMGTTEFMVNRYSQSIEYFDYYCNVGLGYGAILAGIVAILIGISSIAQEVYSVINK